jgi:hypothetical protein
MNKMIEDGAGGRRNQSIEFVWRMWMWMKNGASGGGASLPAVAEGESQIGWLRGTPASLPQHHCSFTVARSR